MCAGMRTGMGEHRLCLLSTGYTPGDPFKTKWTLWLRPRRRRRRRFRSRSAASFSAMSCSYLATSGQVCLQDSTPASAIAIAVGHRRQQCLSHRVWTCQHLLEPSRASNGVRHMPSARLHTRVRMSLHMSVHALVYSDEQFVRVSTGGIPRLISQAQWHFNSLWRCK